jgi:hypothetical protein
MRSLADIQQEFAAAILNGEAVRPQFGLEARGMDATERLSIFRNNTYASLTADLKSVFPVTMQLADERFFNYAAAAFIAASPPREARLSAYGAEFPRFLKGFAPCRTYPIIAEMAGLEWAISDALNAPEEAPLPVQMLGLEQRSLEDGRVLLQPSLRFAASRWPLLSLWRDHAAGRGAEATYLRRGHHRLAVMRQGQDIHFLALDSARFAFWRSLCRGQSLSIATQRAISRDPLFSLLTELLLLFRLKLVTGFSASSKPTQKDT